MLRGRPSTCWTDTLAERYARVLSRAVGAFLDTRQERTGMDGLGPFPKKNERWTRATGWLQVLLGKE